MTCRKVHKESSLFVVQHSTDKVVLLELSKPITIVGDTYLVGRSWTCWEMRIIAVKDMNQAPSVNFGEVSQ